MQRRGKRMGIEIVFLVEEAPEGGYLPRSIEHAIFTEADSMQKLLNQVRDAVRCHFEPADAPAFIRLHGLDRDMLLKRLFDA